MNFFYLLRVRYTAVEKFIKKYYHQARIQIKSLYQNQQRWSWIRNTILFLGEVCLAGILIHYAITKFNWISIAVWYGFGHIFLEWFVTLIKKRE